MRIELRPVDHGHSMKVLTDFGYVIGFRVELDAGGVFAWTLDEGQVVGVGAEDAGDAVWTAKRGGRTEMHHESMPLALLNVPCMFHYPDMCALHFTPATTESPLEVTVSAKSPVKMGVAFAVRNAP